MSLIAGRLPGASSRPRSRSDSTSSSGSALEGADAAGVIGTELTLAAPRASSRRRSTSGPVDAAEIVGVVSQEVGDGLSLVPLRDRPRPLGPGRVGTRDRFVRRRTRRRTPRCSSSRRGLEHVTECGPRSSRSVSRPVRPETLITQVQRYVHVVELVLAGIGLIGLSIAALGHLERDARRGPRTPARDRRAQGGRRGRSRDVRRDASSSKRARSVSSEVSSGPRRGS